MWMSRLSLLITILTPLFLSAEVARSQSAETGIKFRDIGDTSIIKESDAIIMEADKLQKEISEKPFARDRALDFNKIRPVRSKLSKRSLELRGLLENFRQYRTSLKAQLQQKLESKSAQDAAALIDIGIERGKRDLDTARADLDRYKSLLTRATAEAKRNDEAKENDQRDFNTKIASLELEIRSKTIELGFLEKTKASITNTASATQQEIDDLKKSVAEIDGIIDEAQSRLRRLDETLVNLDEVSATLLQTDILNINYTDRSTYIFGALVGAVIIGFFLIAFLSREVRDAIFTGESGIQFVTLFSLVIAIILFGVLKILEGKELAALLGGLSGYILGRGSTRLSQAGQGQAGQGQAGPGGAPPGTATGPGQEAHAGAPTAGR
jgi:hypothetical protein